MSISPSFSAATVSSTYKSLVDRAILWENHACMPLRPGEYDFLDQLQQYRHIGASFVSLNVNFDMMPWHLAIKMLATFRHWIREHADEYVLALSTDDVLKAKRENKLAIGFDIEGGASIDDLPELVEPYYALGVRWMLIAYNKNNRLGGGCMDDDSGLTAFGRRVIDEMQRVGMVLCCSHTGYRTAREAIEYSQNPTIFSHSNPRQIYDHERNIPDDLIDLCAASGGVVNLNGLGVFLGDNDNSTETMVRHIDYIASRVGSEHVGLGLDYPFDESELEDFVASNPEFFPPDKFAKGIRLVEPTRIPEVIDRLQQMGWPDDALINLMGGNNFRVAQQVWK